MNILLMKKDSRKLKPKITGCSSMAGRLFRFAFLVLLNLMLLNSVSGQESISTHFWQENGLPYVRNFGPKEYGENPQNWWIVQDKRGLMYFANNHGVLIYDGVFWRLVKIPNQSVVRSLCLKNDRIYFGGLSDIGYLEANAIGDLNSVSLLNKIPEENRDFKDVWAAVSTSKAVFFTTPKYIFQWSDNEMRVFSAIQRFRGAFVVHDEFYTHERGIGLMKLVGDSLQVVSGSEKFAGATVHAILSYDETRILIATDPQGLFLYDGKDFIPFRTQVDDFLLEKDLYQGVRLTHDLFAFATLRGGVIIIDKNGNFCQVLSKSAGLRDEQVWYAFVDREGALWLALNNGLARVETPASLSRFSTSSGIESSVESIIRHNGTLYIGTHQGAFYLKQPTIDISFPEFKPV